MDVSPLEPEIAHKLQSDALRTTPNLTDPAMALDGTVRRFDDDGHLRISRCVLSAAGVSPYRGREIPDYQRFGLDPQQVYAIYRPASELARAAGSFDGKPILASHCPIHASQHPRGMTIGAVGHATLDDDNLIANLTIWDGEAINGISSGAQRSVSAGYRYRVVAEDGCVGGQTYSLKMMDIQFNHLALVERPRVPQAVIGDHALDEALDPIISNAPVKNSGHGELTSSMPAHGERHIPEAGEKSTDAGESMKPASSDAHGRAGQAEQDRLHVLTQSLYAALQDRTLSELTAPKSIGLWLAAHWPRAPGIRSPGKAPVPENQTGQDLEAAFADAPDQATLALIRDAVLAERHQNQRAERARQEVRPLVGDVCGLDDAEAIYRYALQQMDVPTEDVEASALPSLVMLASRAHGVSSHAVGQAADTAAPYETPNQQMPGHYGQHEDTADIGSILFGIPVPKKL